MFTPRHCGAKVEFMRSAKVAPVRMPFKRACHCSGYTIEMASNIIVRRLSSGKARGRCAMQQEIGFKPVSLLCW